MRNTLLALSLLFPLFTFAKDYTGVDGRKVSLVGVPPKILVLNASNVEIFYGLGKQELIVGTDMSVRFPPETESIPKVGHPYRPSVEGMISLKPDLVLSSEENLSPSTAEQLRTAKIPVLIIENSGKDGIEGLKNRVRFIATLTGAEDKGKALVEKIDNDLLALSKKTKTLKPNLKVFFLYAHGPGDAYVYGRETGSHALIELIGATNAADFTTGTKPLTSEAMVQASPDVIIMLHRGLKAVGGIDGALKLPGVSLTPAGKNKKIVAVDDSIRWVSPRFPEFGDKLFNDIIAK
ncbi:MAG: ABC transporter substrate-binding protein [Bdellovibrionaceae bacterium]|nr:ABC transporter substrate-binding protein [Pseudobdellovibrionaceae bacterium]